MTDVVTADLDTDGLPEFLVGMTAIKAASEREGSVQWELDVPVSRRPVLADLQGDGFSVILLGCGDGMLRVYQGTRD